MNARTDRISDEYTIEFAVASILHSLSIGEIIWALGAAVFSVSTDVIDLLPLNLKTMAFATLWSGVQVVPLSLYCAKIS
jgi:hypothetical protein